MHFDNQYFSRQMLQHAWVATEEVGMATWKKISYHRSNRDPAIHNNIDQTFKA